MLDIACKRPYNFKALYDGTASNNSMVHNNRREVKSMSKRCRGKHEGMLQPELIYTSQLQ